MLGELIDPRLRYRNGRARRQGEGHPWPHLRIFPFYIMCGMERSTPTECVPFLGIGAGARPLLHTEATFRRARAFARNPQRLDCVAGVGGLEVRRETGKE